MRIPGLIDSLQLQLCGDVGLQQALRITTLFWSSLVPWTAISPLPFSLLALTWLADENILEATNLAEHNLLHAQILKMSSVGFWSF